MKKLSLLFCLLGSSLASAEVPAFIGLYGGGYTTLGIGGRTTVGLGAEGAYFVTPEISAGIHLGSLPSGDATFVYGAKGRYHFPQVPGLNAGIFIEGWRVTMPAPFEAYNSGDWGFLAGYEHRFDPRFSVGGELQFGDLFQAINFLATARYYF